MCGDLAVIKDRGKCVVDCTIVCKNFLGNIVHLKIGEPTYLSDHNLVETVLNCQIKRETPKVKISNLRNAYDKFIWHSESSVLYKEALKDVDSQAMIKNIFGSTV